MTRKRRKSPLHMYSVEEVAEIYEFHPNTVRNWVNRDNLRSYRKGRGNKMYIREDDLKDFLAKFYEP